MTRLAQPARRRQPVAGLPGLPGAGGDQGGRAPRDRRRRQPVRDHLGRRAAARRDRRASSQRLYGVPVDPEREITVTCGSTEAMVAALLAIVDPGDEVVVFEPFYENYGPDAILSGAVPRFVQAASRPTGPSTPTSWRARSPRAPAPSSSTRPTTRPARSSRARSSRRSPRCAGAHDALAVTDEIYEHILYDGAVHVPIAIAAGHGRAHGHDQRHEQDLQRDRLARGLDDRAAGADRRDPQGARLPDRRRGGAAPGSGALALELPATYYTWRSPRATRGAATAWCRSSSAPASASTGRPAPTT